MYKIVEHPLIKIKLSRMRNKNTDSRDFRSNLLELSQFMSFEVTKDLKLTTFEIETPLAKTNGYKLETPVVLVPILRAGLGMVDGFKLMCPQASIGHIGLYRDEQTLKPIQSWNMSHYPLSHHCSPSLVSMHRSSRRVTSSLTVNISISRR